MEDKIRQAFDEINSGKTLEGLEKLEALKSDGAEDHRIDFGRAVAMARLGRLEPAVGVLKVLVEKYPDFRQARDILTELEKVSGRPPAQVETSAVPALPQPTASPQPAAQPAIPAKQASAAPQASPQSVQTISRAEALKFAFYGPTLLTPSTLAKIAASTTVWQELLNWHAMLATDQYVAYVDAFYRQCLTQYGQHWFYLDITNVLYAASKLIQPKNYLEIGVRRGRSCCAVVRGCPTVDITACDMWIQNYAGMENPGPDFVFAEVQKHGFRGHFQVVNGNSHEMLPKFFSQNPGRTFDLITVDGDHTEQGAYQDLHDVLPHLAVGGAIVFDDISHPAHPYLLEVWRRAARECGFLATYEFAEQGYGVAFGIRVK
ncbi:MAG: class I SAM-dependent methyltransferase [Planctomycetes bacterium]|nr:class I SAM-dependent methyltransferase [Planctomycetota bacterium]